MRKRAGKSVYLNVRKDRGEWWDLRSEKCSLQLSTNLARARPEGNTEINVVDPVLTEIWLWKTRRTSENNTIFNIAKLVNLLLFPIFIFITTYLHCIMITSYRYKSDSRGYLLDMLIDYDKQNMFIVHYRTDCTLPSPTFMYLSFDSYYFKIWQCLETRSLHI